MTTSYSVVVAKWIALYREIPGIRLQEEADKNGGLARFEIGSNRSFHAAFSTTNENGSALAA